MGQFERKFQTKGASPTNHCWYTKTSVIAISCGMKIRGVHCLVLSQSMRVADGGRTGLRLPIDDAGIAASRGKNEVSGKETVQTR